MSPKNPPLALPPCAQPGRISPGEFFCELNRWRQEAGQSWGNAPSVFPAPADQFYSSILPASTLNSFASNPPLAFRYQIACLPSVAPLSFRAAKLKSKIHLSVLFPPRAKLIQPLGVGPSILTRTGWGDSTCCFSSAGECWFFLCHIGAPPLTKGVVADMTPAVETDTGPPPLPPVK